MKTLRKILKRARGNPRVVVAMVLVASLVGGLVALNQRAARESDARKSPEALQLEKNPEEWLSHQQNASHFQRALDDRMLSVVGLANGLNSPGGAQSGVVLYTLKNGEKASAAIPGCTALGCAGTVLDKLGDKSAAAGFTLVGVDVDARTPSHRVLDVINNLLSPLILIATLVGALFVGVKLQAGIGGAASRLSTRRSTRSWARPRRAACCWWARRAPARRCWPRRSRARARPISLPWTAPTSPQCFTAPASAR